MKMKKNLSTEEQGSPDVSAQHDARNIPYKIWPNGLIWGFAAGFCMGVYILLLQFFGEKNNIALKFLKYIFLVGIIGFVLGKYRKINRTSTYFQKSIFLGAVISAVSAVAFFVFDGVVSLIDPAYSFTRFNYQIDSPLDFMITGAGTFFEVLVFGVIGTLIWLEYFKKRGQETSP